MSVNYVYKIEKGFEKGVLDKLFQNGNSNNCTLIGDAAGAMSAREIIAKGKPRVKILEFKKATYIKSEAEIRASNLLKVRSVGD